jgi:hypothetical protein
MNHFVVLDGFRGNKAYLNDPARGDVEVSMEEFDESFTGVTIIPTPGPDFVPRGQPKSMLDFAKKRLVGAGAAVAFVMLTTAIGSQVPLNPQELTGLVSYINTRSVAGILPFFISAFCYAGTAVVLGFIGNAIDKKVRILR